MKNDPFPMTPEELEYFWSKFPEMTKEEFDAFFEIYKNHSDFKNMYFDENNEAI